MSVFKQVEINTAPAKEAGDAIGTEVVRAVSRKILGANWSELIKGELMKSAKEGNLTFDDLQRRYKTSIRAYGKASGWSEARISQLVQSMERHATDWNTMSDSGRWNLVSRLISDIGKFQTGLVTSADANDLQIAQKAIERQIGQLEKRAKNMWRTAGSSKYESEQLAAQSVDKYRQALATAAEYYPATGAKSKQGRLDVDATNRNLAQIVSDMESSWEFFSRQEEGFAQSNKRARQHERDLKKERAELERVLKLYDRYLKMTGEDPATRRSMIDADRSAIRRAIKGKSYKSSMKKIGDFEQSYKEFIEDEVSRRELERAKEKMRNELRGMLRQAVTDQNAFYKMAGLTKFQRFHQLSAFRAPIEQAIDNMQDYKDYQAISRQIRTERQLAMVQENGEKLIGFTGRLRDLRERMGGVVARAKRAESLENGTTAAAQRADDLQREYRRKIRMIRDISDINKINKELDAIDANSQRILHETETRKGVEKALKNYKHRVERETDDLIKRGQDRQRFKNMFNYVPYWNARYADTPFLQLPILRHIPFLGRAGFGQGSLDAHRDDIIRQIRDAKSIKEIDAIRSRYEFARRRDVYDRDLERYRHRKWLPIRNEAGEYMPTLNKLGEGFMRTTNKLATAWIAVMWARMTAQMVGAPLVGLLNQADTHTRQRNMYNVSLPYGMTAGKTFEQWEDESFAKARALRMKASDWREMVMNAAPIFHTAVYGEDYKKGALGVDQKTHYQGERIVTNMGQVETIASNLHRMAKISGSTDIEMQAALRQVIQMVSKGRGNIQDIRPILESGGHMGDMIARFGFGASGAADLYKLNEKKELTADRLLKNLLSDKTSDDLRELMRRSARTWEEVAGIMKSDLSQLLLPTIRALAVESEYGLGDTLTSMTKALGDQKWLGEAIRDKITDVLDEIQKNWKVYLSQFLQFSGSMLMIGSVVATVLGSLAIGMNFIQKGAMWFAERHSLGNIVDESMASVGVRNTSPFASWQDKLSDYVFGAGESLGKFENPLIRDYLKRKGVDLDSLKPGSEKYRESVANAIGLMSGDITQDSVYQAALDTTKGRYSEARVKGFQLGFTNANKLANRLKMEGVPDILGGYQRGQESISDASEMIWNTVTGMGKTGRKLVEAGQKDSLDKIIEAVQTQKEKQEAERFPGHAIETNTGTTAGNTGKTAENTRKANQIQLAILKQVAGTRVINRVVHVNPNIVSNVGTIRNGIEYDQLLKDLGSTVNHAVTAYAL